MADMSEDGAGHATLMLEACTKSVALVCSAHDAAPLANAQYMRPQVVTTWLAIADIPTLT